MDAPDLSKLGENSPIVAAKLVQGWLAKVVIEGHFVQDEVYTVHLLHREWPGVRIEVSAYSVVMVCNCESEQDLQNHLLMVGKLHMCSTAL